VLKNLPRNIDRWHGNSVFDAGKKLQAVKIAGCAVSARMRPHRPRIDFALTRQWLT
jgi:hypothetical protein